MKRLSLVVVLLSMLVLAACGGDSDEGDSGDDAGTAADTSSQQADGSSGGVSADGDTLTTAVGNATLTMSTVDGTWTLEPQGVVSSDLVVVLGFSINRLSEDTFPELGERAMERFLAMPSDAAFSVLDGVEYYINEDTETSQQMFVALDERTAVTVSLTRILEQDITPYKAALLAALPTISVSFNE